jgi:ornithine--oxo-acid transaminase
LVSRAFHSDNLGEWYEKVCKLSGKDKALPMNTGEKPKLLCQLDL